MTVRDILYQNHATVDENKRLSMYVVCDGTYYFMWEMLQVLELLECTDIQTEEIIDDSFAPQGKPWCNCKFIASGVLPKEVEIC